MEGAMLELVRDLSIAAGLLLVFLGLVFDKGPLALRREVREAKELADVYRRAWEDERKVNAENNKALGELIHYANNADKVLTALDNANRHRGGGSS